MQTERGIRMHALLLCAWSAVIFFGGPQRDKSSNWRQDLRQQAAQAKHSRKASALRMVKRIKSHDPWVLRSRYQHIKEEQKLCLAQLHELSFQVKQTEQ